MSAFKNYFRLLAEDRQPCSSSSLFLPLTSVSSWVYGGQTSLMRSLYGSNVLKRKKLPLPVISVGNLTWGGTGKTPFVEYLARKFSEKKKKPLVLIRGYGEDESNQLKNHLSKRAFVGVGKNRFKVAKHILKEQAPSIAILDDGMQHWPLARDLEIIVVNALNPFGNGKLIPRGILREPVERLALADIVVLSHVNLIKPKELQALRKRIQEVAPQAEIVDTCLEPLFFYRAEKKMRISLQKLKNKRVTTITGIGTPRSFQLLLQQHQIKPARNFEFLDHHHYTDDDVSEVKRISESAAVDEVVTTEKDFHRGSSKMLEELNPLVLATRLRVLTGEEALVKRIKKLWSTTN